MPVIYTTYNKIDIYADKGQKSENDFIVRYREPEKHLRTPKHIHLVVDLFAKRTGNAQLTNNLISHIIDQIILQICPCTEFPPQLQVFRPEHTHQFEALNPFGEYSTEFLLVIIELIMIQEKTNYPNGTLNLKLFKNMLAGADIFSIVSAATFH